MGHDGDARPMKIPPGSSPTFARELLEARAGLGVEDHVGLALRAVRHRLGMSQRRYAAHRGLSATHLARLEAVAGGLRLRDVVAALEGTGYALTLCRTQEEPGPAGPSPAAPALPVPVPAEEWPRTELLARVRDGSPRFPAHQVTEQTSYGPSGVVRESPTSGTCHRDGHDRPTSGTDMYG